MHLSQEGPGRLGQIKLQPLQEEIREAVLQGTASREQLDTAGAGRVSAPTTSQGRTRHCSPAQGSKWLKDGLTDTAVALPSCLAVPMAPSQPAVGDGRSLVMKRGFSSHSTDRRALCTPARRHGNAGRGTALG